MGIYTIEELSSYKGKLVKFKVRDLKTLKIKDQPVIALLVNYTEEEEPSNIFFKDKYGVRFRYTYMEVDGIEVVDPNDINGFLVMNKP